MDKGRMKFAVAVKKAGGPERVALALGVSRTTIDNLLEGSNPSLSVALKIETLYGVSPREWLEPIEVETVTVKRIA
jgi:transcriptional regulator with XRE-family HTH domain